MQNIFILASNNKNKLREMKEKLAPLGIEVDKETNSKIAGFKEIHEGIITTENSRVAAWVVPTNEELMIIKDTYNIVSNM